MNSVPQHVPFVRVLSGGSSCVSKLSRVLFASTGTSLREPEQDMDGLTTAKSRLDVGKWLRKGFRSCGKAAAMVPARAKCERGDITCWERYIPKGRPPIWLVHEFKINLMNDAVLVDPHIHKLSPMELEEARRQIK